MKSLKEHVDNNCDKWNDEPIGEFTTNPVYESWNGWYFNDETGDNHGPFKDNLQAWEAFRKYCDWLENGDILP